MTLDLACGEHGAGAPLVILHGLYGAKRNWATIAARLAPRRRVLTVDLRNHGESPWDPRHDYPALAADVARLIETRLIETRLIETRVGGPADVLGHSMGGKAAMILALSRSELVSRLVVVDIAPAPSPGTAAVAPHVLRAVPLSGLVRRTEVEEALAATIPDPAVRAFLAANVRRGPDGLAWTINLEAIDRHFAEILSFPEIAAGVAFTKPTLFIAGGRSDYLRPEHRPAIERLFPGAVVETIAGAGHWVHAEAPAAFLEVVERCLDG
jgi:pimeloyl-ACP methyl ester carboxylesterase